MHFYVWDVSYPIVSVARLLLQGYRVALDGPDLLGLFMPNGKAVSVHRKGSLLSLGPNILPFDEVCQEFHSKFGSGSSGTIAPTFKPTTYHDDSWELDPQRAVLIRHHQRARRASFTPGGTKDSSHSWRPDAQLTSDSKMDVRRPSPTMTCPLHSCMRRYGKILPSPYCPQGGVLWRLKKAKVRQRCGNSILARTVLDA